MARIKVMEDELAHKDEVISQLRAAMGLEIAAPLCLNLTQKEAAIFGILVKRPIALKSQIYALMYSLGDSEVEPKIIDVFVCKMRPKLKRFGIDLETVWGQGYKISDASRQLAQELMASSLQTDYDQTPANGVEL